MKIFKSINKFIAITKELNQARNQLVKDAKNIEGTDKKVFEVKVKGDIARAEHACTEMLGLKKRHKHVVRFFKFITFQWGNHSALKRTQSQIAKLQGFLTPDSSKPQNVNSDKQDGLTSLAPSTLDRPLGSSVSPVQNPSPITVYPESVSPTTLKAETVQQLLPKPVQQPNPIVPKPAQNPNPPTPANTNPPIQQPVKKSEVSIPTVKQAKVPTQAVNDPGNQHKEVLKKVEKIFEIDSPGQMNELESIIKIFDQDLANINAPRGIFHLKSSNGNRDIQAITPSDAKMLGILPSGSRQLLKAAFAYYVLKDLAYAVGMGDRCNRVYLLLSPQGKKINADGKTGDGDGFVGENYYVGNLITKETLESDYLKVTKN